MNTRMDNVYIYCNLNITNIAYYSFNFLCMCLCISPKESFSSSLIFYTNKGFSFKKWVFVTLTLTL